MKKYVRESIARFRKFSIEKKLKWLRMVVIIPALVGIITLLVIMINFNESYNEAVKNVSVASKFNFSFSEDMDYKMYRIVIGAESFDTMKPYEEIKEAKELVKELNKNAVTAPENSGPGNALRRRRRTVQPAAYCRGSG